MGILRKISDLEKNIKGVKFKLKDILNERNISKGELRQATELSSATINRYYHGGLERIDITVLFRILYVLELDDIINDLFEFEYADDAKNKE